MTKIKLSIILLLLISCSLCKAKEIENNENALKKALADIQVALPDFDENLKGQMGIDSAIFILMHDKRIPIQNEFHKCIFGNLIFSMRPEKSFQFHEEAFLKNPNDQNFILEYAIELHRKQEFAKAIEQYKKILTVTPKNYKVNVWLADCCINLLDVKTALYYWKQADHPKNHTGIDRAIFSIYGTDPIIKRDSFLTKVKEGKIDVVSDLIALDANWKSDWWNLETKDEMMIKDIKYTTKLFGENNESIKILVAYYKIKTSTDSDSIKRIFRTNNLIIDNGVIPKNGDIASDLISICIENNLISEKEFYSKRGSEILKMAKESKDAQMLNLYAHLQLTTTQKIDEEIAHFGLYQCKDERFAFDYFTVGNEKLKCDTTEIEKAIKDFPNSSILFLIKCQCKQDSEEPKKDLLIEMIRREFKSLGTDPNKYSYQLKKYFALLEKEK